MSEDTTTFNDLIEKIRNGSATKEEVTASLKTIPQGPPGALIPESPKPTLFETPKDITDIVLVGILNGAVKSELDLFEGASVHIGKSDGSMIGPLTVLKEGNKIVLARHDMKFMLAGRSHDGFVKASPTPIINPELQKFLDWKAGKLPRTKP